MQSMGGVTMFGSKSKSKSVADVRETIDRIEELFSGNVTYDKIQHLVGSNLSSVNGLVFLHGKVTHFNPEPAVNGISSPSIVLTITDDSKKLHLIEIIPTNSETDIWNFAEGDLVGKDITYLDISNDHIAHICMVKISDS